MVALGYEAYVMPIKHPLPPELRQVWRWFHDLHELRGFDRLTEPVQMPDGRLGWQVKARALPLNPMLIESWLRLSRLQLKPWQFATLTLIDRFYLKLTNDPPATAATASADNLRNMFKALGMKAKKQGLQDG